MTTLAELIAAEAEAFDARSGRPLPARADGVRAFLPESGPPLALIAEYKRSSPSHGPFAPQRVGSAVRRFEELGASAVSVLVAERGFDGSLADLAEARAATSLPLLLKGFVSLPGQIDEACAHGADAVLLIARVLGAALGDFVRRVRSVGLEPLVEAHDAAELAAALRTGARCIGINNRDLGSLRTDTSLFLRLAPLAPAGAMLVAESGYRRSADIRAAQRAGARAVLIGEGLLDPAGGTPASWAEVTADVG